LTWDDIDGDRVRVHSNYTLTHGLKASTKTNKPRWVPLNSKAKHVLTELERTSTYRFPWNRYALQTYFRMKWISSLMLAGQGPLSPYDLRQRCDQPLATSRDHRCPRAPHRGPEARPVTTHDQPGCRANGPGTFIRGTG
jgi:integrase